ncbi:MAG: hypothetical protein IGR78_08985 [Fischerella thermalis M58_A2018_009]|nr:hypothetical protein [Fischerella thermalis M58_A2018_009]
MLEAQLDQLQGDSDLPAIEDRQNLRFGGGFKPKSKKGEEGSKPSATRSLFAHRWRARASSALKIAAFQGGSLGKNITL